MRMHNERDVLCDADADSIRYSQLRASILWRLDAALSLFGTGQPPFLTDMEQCQGAELLQLHLLPYQRYITKKLCALWPLSMASVVI